MSHTKGKFEIDSTNRVFNNASDDPCRNFIVAICKNVGITDIEESANAKLICDAFNVTNETGLTPRELLAQRDELVEALKDILDFINKPELEIPFSLSAKYFSEVNKIVNLLNKINQ